MLDKLPPFKPPPRLMQSWKHKEEALKFLGKDLKSYLRVWDESEGEKFSRALNFPLSQVDYDLKNLKRTRIRTPRDKSTDERTEPRTVYRSVTNFFLKRSSIDLRIVNGITRNSTVFRKDLEAPVKDVSMWNFSNFVDRVTNNWIKNGRRIVDKQSRYWVPFSDMFSGYDEATGVKITPTSVKIHGKELRLLFKMDGLFARQVFMQEDDKINEIKTILGI